MTAIKVLVVIHGLGFGGAQISTLEFLELLKGKVKLKILVCNKAHEVFFARISQLRTNVYRVPCHVIMNYPVMDIKYFNRLIEWADLAWITDVEYLVASQIKRSKRVPIVAHLRSYALICPWWSALYGLKETCIKRCSLWRIIRCKQGVNMKLAEIGLLSSSKARLYWFLDFAKGPLGYFRWRKLMEDIIDSINGFIPVSQTLWNIHIKHLPELRDRPFKVIYNPVTEPLRYIKPDPNEPYSNYVLYASGPNPVKGPHLLLEAWSTISKEFKDLKLYMIGCKDTWVERVAKRMNSKNIVFLNKLPSETYYKLMYKAKAVVIPSIWPEPFGRIPVEANRLGVPAVVSSAGGLPETIVEGVTGYIFRSSDVEELTEKMMRVLEKDFSRSDIIKHSYEKINPQREIGEMIKFFERVIENEGG